MKALKTFWQFSRPHTIIGSICSVTTLYILVLQADTHFVSYFYILLYTLIASLACNVFIVGLNQLIDVAVDKINKPYLPLASGTMRTLTAKKIIALCCIIALVFAFITSIVLGWLIVIILLLGIAYSVPPIQLKKHHLPAAIAITLVRGVLVNVVMFIHFRYAIYHTSITAPLPHYLYVLTLFIIAFSIAIAWFKDLPDTEGDAQFNFKTLSILYSKKTALWAGSILVIAAYTYCIYWAIDAGQVPMLFAHCFLLVLFLLNIATVKLSNTTTIKSFYLRFWVFFFAEYILFAVWALYKSF